MSSKPHHSNLAARMGRWSAAHWKNATFGWLAFVVVAFALGGVVGTKNIDPNTPGPGESGRMDKILDAGFKQPARESVLVQSRSARVGDAAFAAAIGDVVARVSKRRRSSQNVRRGAGLEGPARRARRVRDPRRQRQGRRQDRAGPRRASPRAQRAHPGFTIGEFGDASAQKGVETAYGNDLGEGRRCSRSRSR